MKDKSILLTVALLAGMMLIGCSKSESEYMEESSRTEQEQMLTKEKIVGVWCSGDYWVSFAEDNFMCAYLSDKCIAEGTYDIIQDEIIVLSDFFEHHMTMFKILSITEDVLQCAAKYSEIEIKHDVSMDGVNYNDTAVLSDVETIMNFTKSQDKPTIRKNEITDKVFEFYSTYELSQNVGWRDLAGMETSWQSVGKFLDDGSTIRYIYKLLHDGTPDTGYSVHMKDLYVYLAPYIYLIERHDEKYNIEVAWIKLRPCKIQKIEVSFDQSGKLLLHV